MKIVFAGTPEFAIPSLSALIHSHHEIAAVYTQPDRPKGRGRILSPTPIKELALKHNLTVYTPSQLKDNTAIEQLQLIAPDILVVVAYGLILPKVILDIPRYGGINIHPSLLPKWRGASPIQSTLLAGDTTTGVAIIQMNEKMDAGAIYQQEHIELSSTISSAELHDITATIGARLLLSTLNNISNNTIQLTHQDNTQATYCKKITKESAKIDWNNTATAIHNKIRAYNPTPVAYTEINNRRLRIWQSSVINTEKHDLPAGLIIHADQNGIDVITGEGVLRIMSLQSPGKKRLAIADWIHSSKALLEVNKTILT